MNNVKATKVTPTASSSPIPSNHIPSIQKGLTMPMPKSASPASTSPASTYLPQNTKSVMTVANKYPIIIPSLSASTSTSLTYKSPIPSPFPTSNTQQNFMLRHEIDLLKVCRLCFIICTKVIYNRNLYPL
eukprot:Pompholyxophrys_sp_v1_NODE_9_length_5690_cov_16.428039.p4 type:complete len:130 gc:universal NODE_9_length_5690_cov_16.428039:3388-3777(+)